MLCALITDGNGDMLLYLCLFLIVPLSSTLQLLHSGAFIYVKKQPK